MRVIFANPHQVFTRIGLKISENCGANIRTGKNLGKTMPVTKTQTAVSKQQSKTPLTALLPLQKRNIGIVALSSALPDHAAMDRAASYFAKQGFGVSAPEATWLKHQRFAGTDQQRLDALNEVVADPAVGLIMAARGGYGLSRLMDKINWKKLADSGKPVLGFSDVTALQLGLLAKTGTQSLHGPFAVSFGGDSISSFTEDHFWSVMETGRCEVKVRAAKQPPVQEEGVLWGGNLEVFNNMLGTPYMPNIKKGILFFEDVSVQPYRIERALLQLKQSGILDQQRALVLGQFTGYKLGDHENGYNFDELVKYMRTQTKVPILTGLQFGHVADLVTLPFGCKVKLESSRGGYSITS
jgi:muramoyltetrapeptide carboxypeptidase